VEARRSSGRWGSGLVTRTKIQNNPTHPSQSKPSHSCTVLTTFLSLTPIDSNESDSLRYCARFVRVFGYCHTQLFDIRSISTHGRLGTGTTHSSSSVGIVTSPGVINRIQVLQAKKKLGPFVPKVSFKRLS
jgi:hypothetical protein